MTDDWDRVAETVKRRRLDLGISQRAAAMRGGMSPTTWGSLETHHQRIDDLSRPRFCRALGWTADSIDRILNGDDPEVDGDAAPPLSIEEQVSELQDRVAALTEAVAGLLDAERPAT